MEAIPPFSADNFLAPQGGQVAGLGRGAVQAILADYGIACQPAAACVADLIEAALARQRECPGVMAAGAMIQRLVGATIETALPDARIDRRSMLSIRDSLLLMPRREEKETSSSATQLFM
ncbi:MAG: hypothetical protein NTV33_09805 [Coprothermobacterota bacterium]|nr:hypothetical protein [Coprothermobacterota bacterium]